ncbi:hypothetical protein [Faecalibacillus faecis]|uniref:hypothetical protein n=1 Tax=Faecalibacillus faecis TaxID=1982628 RepID=UPI003867D1AC
MNEFLRNFVMTTILKMIDNNVAEWQVREYALGWYTKEILTEEDLQTIDEKYKEKEETEQLNTEVNSNEQIEQPLEENIESEEE